MDALPDGFVLGTHDDGSEIYVGRAFLEEITVPGRLQITEPKGLYFPSTTELSLTRGIEYLSIVGDDCGCEFVACNTTSCLVDLGAIAVSIVFGITKHEIVSGELIFDALGVAIPIEGETFYIDENGEQAVQNFPFNVLACAIN